MLTLLTLGAAISFAAPPALPTEACLTVLPVAGDVDLRELYEAGQTWDEFLAGADRRRELWVENWEEVSPHLEPELFDRVAAVGGEWHFLVVAVAGCSDSVNTVPFLARLAASADNVHMRVVDSDVGADVMSSHPTPDGRGATPTIVLMNGDFEEAGCFIERPRWLRDYTLENPEDLDRTELYRWKMGWYAGDRGHSTAVELVEMLEAAASGSPQCATYG